MEAEHTSLSCIVIDAAGDPIAQVAYRCALCRKICDSTTDAMLHYQVEHVDLFSYNLQQQQQQQQQQHQYQAQQQRQQVVTNSNARNSSLNALNNIQQHGLGRQHQTVTTANSLLKRSAPNSQPPGSLLKRANASGGTGSTSSQPTAPTSSLLKRASNVIRNYQANTTRNKKPNSAGPASSTTAPKVDPNIHRPYTTTSASRAAKRYASGGSPNTSATNQSSTSRSSQAASESSEGHEQGNSRSGSQQLATRSSTVARKSNPRHIERTNQYTANLKAKISAQKSAAAAANQRQSTASQSTVGSSQRSSAGSSSSLANTSGQTDVDGDTQPSTSARVAAGGSGAGDSTSSNATAGASDSSISGTQQTTTTSSPSTSQEATPGADGKDSSKRYSLRARSLGRRSVIIS